MNEGRESGSGTNQSINPNDNDDNETKRGDRSVGTNNQCNQSQSMALITWSLVNQSETGKRILLLLLLYHLHFPPPTVSVSVVVAAVSSFLGWFVNSENESVFLLVCLFVCLFVSGAQGIKEGIEPSCGGARCDAVRPGCRFDVD